MSVFHFQAVLFDAYRTLLALDRPFDHLAEALRTVDPSLPPALAEEALRSEMRYYVRHSLAASDADRLATLRRNCAEVLLATLAAHGHSLPLTPDELVPLLVGSLHWHVYPEVETVLDELAARGMKLGVVSNWDCSLPEVLREVNLWDRFDVVVVSALEGCEKPAPAIFQTALRRLGTTPDRTLHVGDSYEDDVQGARAAGITPVWLSREGDPDRPGVWTIRELGELLPEVTLFAKTASL